MSKIDDYVVALEELVRRLFVILYNHSNQQEAAELKTLWQLYLEVTNAIEEQT